MVRMIYDGKNAENRNLEDEGYSFNGLFVFTSPALVNRFGKLALCYEKGEDGLVVARDAGLSRVIAKFNPLLERENIPEMIEKTFCVEAR